MNSATLPSFWEAYKSLNEDVRRRARKAYQLWAENPFHPSLHFKCINREENIWSARITLYYRAIGILDGDTITWFWIGSHDDYESFFGEIFIRQCHAFYGKFHAVSRVERNIIENNKH